MTRPGIDPQAIGIEIRIGSAGRENARTKAKRLLVEGRVLIHSAGPEGVSAFVRGDSGRLRLVTYENARWFCDCPALGPCSHIMAVQSVTLVSDDLATDTALDLTIQANGKLLVIGEVVIDRVRRFGVARYLSR